MFANRPIRILLVFGGWTLVGLFAASRLAMSYAYSGYDVAWGFVLQLSLTQAYGWALLFPLIFWLARRFDLTRLWWRDVAVHLLFAIVVAYAKVSLDAYTLPLVTGSSYRIRGINEGYSNFVTYIILAGLVMGAGYYTKFRERALRASQLEARLAQARLSALQMQLHPHFLFNTLNSISALMHRDVEAADRMLARLSELLRLTLEAGDEPEIPLRRELEFLDRYLEIEKVRFGPRLHVQQEIDPETLDAQVPNFLLQPLVENAIRHGIAPHARPGRIDLRFRRRDDRLQVEVADNGAGLSVAQTRAVREGVGLANIRARLRELYGEDHRLELRNGTEAGLVVALEIPFRTASV